MAGELVHVRHDEGAGFFPGRSADAASAADPGAGHGALKRTQDKFVSEDTVEPRPVEFHFGVDGGGDVGHVGDIVAFVCSECLDFLQQLRIARFFIGFFHIFVKV